MTQVKPLVKSENYGNTAIALSVNRTHVNKKKSDDNGWDTYNDSFRVEVMSVPHIANTIYNGWAIAPAIYKHRHTENFISAQHIGLDFDNNSIHDLLSNQFVSSYAAILHTTSSHKPEAPRSRALFLLDQPIHDAAQYSEYAKAFTWFNDKSDPQCSDAVRLWFGAKDCQMEIDSNKILPVSVLDELVKEYNQATMTTPERSGFITGDPMSLLDDALKNAMVGNRHNVGFKFYCSMRDIGLTIDEAMGYADIYQKAVGSTGDHPYTWKEAWASLRGAYSRKPRRIIDSDLTKALLSWEYDAWFNRKGLKCGAIHYSLKTVMAVSSLAQKAGRTQGLWLPVREFIDYGVPKDTAANHLKAMVKDGTLLPEHSDNRRGNRYALTFTDETKVNAEQTFNIEISDTYKKLQGMPHFDYGAKIDAQLWDKCPPESNLGPSALRIIAALSISKDEKYAQNLDTLERENNSSLVCLTFAHISSMNMLWKVSGVGIRTGQACFKTLVDLGICTWEYADNKSKIPTLCENWYERLLEIEPALTTFGNKERRKFNYAKQRELHHKAIGRFGSDAEKEISQRVIERASANSAVAHEKFQSAKKKQELWKSEIERKYQSKE